MEAPEVRYAESSGLAIAYQVLGDGAVDLLYVPGWISHLDLYWDNERVARFLRKLGAGFRLIIFDRRGTGLSDPIGDEIPTLEARMDDMRAVLDTVGSTETIVFAQGYGTPLAIMFAASHPARTRSLILYSPVAKTGLRTDDYPWGTTAEEDADWREASTRGWGTEEFARAWLRRLAPSVDGDPREIAWTARLMRASATPGESRRFTVVSAEMDVREILPVVRVPTLVIDRRHAVTPKGGIDVAPAEEAEYVAARIPGAELRVLDGRDYLPWVGDADAIVAEMSKFATGSVDVRDPDRVLLTVLFTDIVGSTEHLARLGDRDWRHLLGLHDQIASAAIERFRGHQVDQAGDGIFATFDGPARAINCAQEMVDRVRAHGLELRAGVHTGECQLDGERVTGIAVHIGARVAAQAAAGEILASRVVTELVAGSGLGFVERGTTELKGVPGNWQLFGVA